MQILAVGIHRLDFSPSAWEKLSYLPAKFYEFYARSSSGWGASEVLFVSGETAKEVFAVAEDLERVRDQIEAFFRRELESAGGALHFHVLQGPEAVRHFFALALGAEAFPGGQDQEFLHWVYEGLQEAEKYGTAGSILNRLYGRALLLKGKVGHLPAEFDTAQLYEKVRQLLQKIFGDLSSAQVILMGHHEAFNDLIYRMLNAGFREIFAYSEDEQTMLGLPVRKLARDELEWVLPDVQAIFRLSQDGEAFFRGAYLENLMHRRKNQPLLIVNLDPSISVDRSLEKIYNIFAYDLSDLLQTGQGARPAEKELTALIDQELEAFFSWFYSKAPYKFGKIIGKSRAIEKILEMVARLSQTDVAVLILGESGTGKELVARTIHETSPRKDRPFVVVNCGAFAENLLERELFGHEKGAVAEAASGKKGVFEEADGGTLFLDEIEEVPPALQVKLLRALEHGEIRREGGTESIRVDVRVIAASSRDLFDMVQKGMFRQDLYYRLNVVTIQIPPLRERPEDILPLSEYFAQRYAEKLKKRITGFTDRAKQLLLSYHWPGNVRELENAIERAVALAVGHQIHASDLPETLREGRIEGILRTASARAKSMKEIEAEVIRAYLELYGWDYERVAEVLEIGRTTLWRKMKAYGIRKPVPPKR
jgi:transcriptional regulator with PAS, ATPase and Fis domain